MESLLRNIGAEKYLVFEVENMWWITKKIYNQIENISLFCSYDIKKVLKKMLKFLGIIIEITEL